MFVIIFLCVLFWLFLVLYSVCLFSRPYLYPWTKSIEFVFTVQIMIPFDETSDLFSIFIQCNKLVGMINRAMDLGRHILYYSLQRVLMATSFFRLVVSRSNNQSQPWSYILKAHDTVAQKCNNNGNYCYIKNKFRKTHGKYRIRFRQYTPEVSLP